MKFRCSFELVVLVSVLNKMMSWREIVTGLANGHPYLKLNRDWTLLSRSRSLRHTGTLQNENTKHDNGVKSNLGSTIFNVEVTRKAATLMTFTKNVLVTMSNRGEHLIFQTLLSI